MGNQCLNSASPALKAAPHTFQPSPQNSLRVQGRLKGVECRAHSRLFTELVERLPAVGKAW